MADSTLSEQLRKQRGKPLNNRQLVLLWDQLVSNSQASPTLKLMRRKTVAGKTNIDARTSHLSRTPNLKDWVKVNRILRGAMVASSNRHRLLEDDIKEILKPRCGHWNIASEDVPLLPNRLRAKLNWARQVELGWDKSVISIFVDADNYLPLGIEADQFRTALERAASTWNAADVGIEISFCSSLAQCDVVASWSSPSLDEHGVLTDNIMAHADFPEPNTQYVSSPPLPMCFNRMQLWSSHVADGTSEATRYDIESMALHELGHCIGLFHRGSGSIMYEVVDKGRHRVLDEDTIQAARRLYAR